MRTLRAEWQETRDFRDPNFEPRRIWVTGGPGEWRFLTQYPGEARRHPETARPEWLLKAEALAQHFTDHDPQMKGGQTDGGETTGGGGTTGDGTGGGAGTSTTDGGTTGGGGTAGDGEVEQLHGCGLA